MDIEVEAAMEKIARRVMREHADVTIARAEPAPEPTAEEREIQAISDEGYALGAVLSALAPLDREARARVLRWAGERFQYVGLPPGGAYPAEVGQPGSTAAGTTRA